MEELRKQLTEVINNSGLPFEAIFYVVKDVFREVSDVYKNMLEQAEAAKNAPKAVEEESDQTVAASDKAE